MKAFRFTLFVKDKDGNWMEWAKYKSIVGLSGERVRLDNLGVEHYTEGAGE